MPYGSITTIISRRFMSNIYGELQPQATSQSWIVFPGQLVEIRRNCFVQTAEFGIIIGCKSPHFGIGYDDDYWVFIAGELLLVKNFMIYPV